jgi:hypothetical protein
MTRLLTVVMTNRWLTLSGRRRSVLKNVVRDGNVVDDDSRLMGSRERAEVRAAGFDIANVHRHDAHAFVDQAAP